MSEENFTHLLGDEAETIQPLKQDKRVSLVKGRERDVSVRQRQRSAQTFSSEENIDPLETDTLQLVAPMDLLSFRKSGVQHGVFKNLRLGKYPLDATLDLHRHTVEQARSALFNFVQDCLENDVRSAIITHGKGEGREIPALLKSCVAHWLPQLEEVLAFHTAQKHHGSYGATYILLKKSDNKKRSTAERLKRGQ